MHLDHTYVYSVRLTVYVADVHDYPEPFVTRSHLAQSARVGKVPDPRTLYKGMYQIKGIYLRDRIPSWAL